MMIIVHHALLSGVFISNTLRRVTVRPIKHKHGHRATLCVSCLLTPPVRRRPKVRAPSVRSAQM